MYQGIRIIECCCSGGSREATKEKEEEEKEEKEEREEKEKNKSINQYVSQSVSQSMNQSINQREICRAPLYDTAGAPTIVSYKHHQTVHS